jgi:hypothetical protein
MTEDAVDVIVKEIEAEAEEKRAPAAGGDE